MTLKLHLDNPEIAREFDALKASLPGADQPWLNDLRSEAMTCFTDSGIPGPKVEEWKYTNLGFLARETFGPASKTHGQSEIKALFDRAHFKNIAGPVVVFVNGYIHKSLSSFPDESGVRLSVFSEQPQKFQQDMRVTGGSSALDNLNKAMVTDGYHIEISSKTPTPIQIIHLATSDSHMRSLRLRGRVSVDPGACGKIIESFMGPDGARYWCHMVGHIELAEDARLEICQYQMQGKQAVHMTELHVTIADRAKFSHMSLQLGAELSRTELVSSFTGEFAHADLRGAYLGRVKQSHDIFTRINHDRPNCQSNQIFRGVLDEGGKSAFQGKVVVARDAQKTNADQSNKNLLLSRAAEANAKPELLIYADDVKCSHGATVGEIDRDQLFYLNSRGLDEAGAKSLLVEAFISEVFDGMDDEILQQRYRENTAGWLKREVTS